MNRGSCVAPETTSKTLPILWNSYKWIPTSIFLVARFFHGSGTENHFQHDFQNDPKIGLTWILREMFYKLKNLENYGMVLEN